MSFILGFIDYYFQLSVTEVYLSYSATLFITLFLIYTWYVIDSKTLGIARTNTWTILILLFGFFVLPIYFFKTRGLLKAFLLTIALMVVLGLSFAAENYGESVGYKVYESKVNTEKLLEKNSILKYVPKTEKMKVFQDQYKSIISRDETPYLYVNAEHDSVILPKSYVKDGKIVLDISFEAMRDFSWKDDRVEFSLSFGEDHKKIVLPFTSLISIYSKETEMGVDLSEIE